MGQLKQAGVPPDLQEIVTWYLECPDTSRSDIGLTAGGSLSPLIAALYLLLLDLAFRDRASDGSVIYRRFMDDFVILATTRRKLRRAICLVHKVLSSLGLRVHEKKRFIGRTMTGFDLLGYTLHPVRRLRLSSESIRRLRERVRRLYEQGASVERLWQYVSRWCSWLWSGVYGRVRRKGGARRYWVWIVSTLNIRDEHVHSSARVGR